jgi:hypothetical protein
MMVARFCLKIKPANEQCVGACDPLAKAGSCLMGRIYSHIIEDGTESESNLVLHWEE